MFDHIDSNEVAFDFARRVRAYVGAENWTEIQRRNTHDSGYRSGACASHDFCDSNMFLFDAIRQAAPAYARAYDAATTDAACEDLQNALAPVWNEIHAIATREYFSEHPAARVTVDRMDSLADHRDVLATAYAVRGFDMYFTRLEFTESLAASIGDDAPPEVWARAVFIIGRFMLGDLESMAASFDADIDIDSEGCPLVVIHGFRAFVADSVISGAAG